MGLDNIIKLKFRTNFDRCAILNVLNCLTKDFEPWQVYSELKLVRSNILLSEIADIFPYLRI